MFDRTEGPVRDIAQLFRFEQLTYTSSTAESKALNTRVGPMIVIAGSGMVEGGRILHHLVNGASNSRNTILIVGYQAENTLGRRIVERRPMIRVLGNDVELRATGRDHQWLQRPRGSHGARHVARCRETNITNVANGVPGAR